MFELVTICFTLGLLVLLLRFKVKLGRAMILCSFVLAMLLRVSPALFWQNVVREWTNKPLSQTTGYLFMTLTALVTCVNILGIALKETGVSNRLVPSIQGLFKSRRVALVSIPLMMGMLPTPGGIMLSSPMVREMGDTIGMDRNRQAALNYLFRHQWESVWPLFPAVPLVQGMLAVTALKLISYNMAIMAAGILGGIVFLLLPGLPPKQECLQPRRRFMENLGGFMHAFWPIVIVAGLYAGLNLNPAVGMFIAIVLFLVVHKVPPMRCRDIFKSGFEFDVVLVILGALLFKLHIEAAGAVQAVVEFLTRINVPPLVLVFFMPFLVVYVTGLSLPTAAITFPFLVPFIGTGPDARLGMEALAFSGIVCGLALSPIHLCIALSAGYFKTGLHRIIASLAGPVIIIAATGVLMALFAA
jgi:integral membrane protein (TIGR00529 family)